LIDAEGAEDGINIEGAVEQDQGGDYGYDPNSGRGLLPQRNRERTNEDG